jgi:hypothetical protein
MHFGDRDALLAAAAVDLVEREVISRPVCGGSDRRPRVLALARHFAEHSPFYRAMLAGSCAFAMTRALNGLYSSLTRTTVRELFGELDEATQDNLAVFFAGGASALTNDWLIDGTDPLDPEELADRLLSLAQVFAPHPCTSVDGGHVR